MRRQAAVCEFRSRETTPLAETQREVPGPISLVDDESGILATLGAILELHDLQVVTAPSAEVAKRLLDSNRFDLVITDMKMESDKAGYTVVEAARHSSGNPPTLIISGCPALAADWEE